MGTPFEVERSVVIDAAPSAIYPHLIDLHKWEAWSPWQDLDPEMSQTYTGADTGVGSAMTWSGNRKAGVGTMTITKTDPDQMVGIGLDFQKPFKSKSDVEITLTPDGDQTTVRWLMMGEQNLFMRIMDKVMNMDKMLGKDFERGLSNLRSVVLT